MKVYTIFVIPPMPTDSRSTLSRFSPSKPPSHPPNIVPPHSNYLPRPRPPSWLSPRSSNSPVILESWCIGRMKYRPNLPRNLNRPIRLFHPAIRASFFTLVLLSIADSHFLPASCNQTSAYSCLDLSHSSPQPLLSSDYSWRPL